MIMTRRAMKIWICLVPLVTSCGTANVNKLFGSKDDSYASLLDRAQLAYDLGDFSAAEELANKAYARSENNGDAGVLLGSIYLSQAGIDIFQMVGKISSLSTPSKTATTTTSTDTCSSTTAANQTAGNLLSELSCKLLNLSEADKDNLGTDKTFSGLSSVGVTSVYVPNEVTDTLRSEVSVLAALDKGVKKLCPFINRTLVVSQSIDERHTSTDVCPDRTSSSYNSAKAHITFALLSLVESLVFQQGVLIDGVSSATSTRTGVSSVSSKINTKSFGTDIATFATTLTEFKSVVDQVFDTSNTKSQIALALNGFIVVSQSFAAAGVPESVTSIITKQLTKLKETANTLKGSSSGSDTTYQAQALKGQINQSYAKTMAAKINTACPTASSCAGDKTSLCASYAGISQGVDPAKVTAPTICQ